MPSIAPEPAIEPPGPFQRKTRIVEVLPPLVKSLKTSTSPSWCWPLNLPELTPLVIGPTALWKNQIPICASPLLAKRSAPK